MVLAHAAHSLGLASPEAAQPAAAGCAAGGDAGRFADGLVQRHRAMIVPQHRSAFKGFQVASGGWPPAGRCPPLGHRQTLWL